MIEMCIDDDLTKSGAPHKLSLGVQSQNDL